MKKVLKKINNNKILFFISLILLINFSSLYASGGKDREMNLETIKLKVFGRTGNFCLYARSPVDESNFIPLYDDRAKGRCNKFFVYYNGSSYELKRPTKIEQNDYSVIVTYEFKDKFLVIQELSFVRKKYGMTAPPLKIKTRIQNMNGNIADMGLKAVFDTNLGEKREVPIYTDLRSGFAKESFMNPRREKDAALISASNEFACIFLIKHSNASPMENIFVANWDRLQSRSWKPHFNQGRSFSTRYFKNDSAILFSWPIEKLGNEEYSDITMLIGYYDYFREKLTKGHAVLRKAKVNEEVQDYALEKEEDEEVEKEEVEEVESEKVEKVEKLEAVKVEPKKEVIEEETYTTETEIKDYEYIKSLLKKIEEIEKNTDEISNDYLEDLTKQADNAIIDIKEEN